MLLCVKQWMNSKSIISALVVTLFAASCSGVKESINQSKLAESKPKPVVQPEVKKSIPEHQKVGYMRIIGDLRWDQLTSPKEWEERFPGCFSAEWRNYSMWESFTMYRSDEGCVFRVANVDIYIHRINFARNSRTKSGIMTERVHIGFADNSHERAFISGLMLKYSESLHAGNESYRSRCSKYTCWISHQITWATGTGSLYIEPTRYAIRLLDNIKIDLSDL